MLIKKIFFLYLVLYLLPAGLLLSQGISGSFEKIPDKTSSNVILFKEDINANGIKETFSAAVRKETGDNTYWISSGSIKENSSGKILLSFNNIIADENGNTLINQEPAENGYIVHINKSSNGIVLIVSIANEYGKNNSDEITIKWNKKSNNFVIYN
jgi:hypothetical protein